MKKQSKGSKQVKSHLLSSLSDVYNISLGNRKPAPENVAKSEHNQLHSEKGSYDTSKVGF